MNRYHRLFMTIRILVLVLLGVALLIARFAKTQGAPASNTARQSSEASVQEILLKIEIQAFPDAAPTFKVTNLASKTLTAANFRFFHSTEATRSTEMAWDPIAQGVDKSRARWPGPLEPNASMTLNLPHIVGAPLPDKAEAAAGIWDDGTTFGDPVSVKLLLQLRSQMAQSYEQAIAFLQQGLEQKWTREQYLQSLPKKGAGPFSSIAGTLRANDRPNQPPSSLGHEIENLLTFFKRNLDQLREAKP